MKTSLSRLGEFGLIEHLLRRSPSKKNKNILVGPGDDCAVVRGSKLLTLLTTDLLVEGVHFRRDWMSAEEIGVKAMRVNLSDIAAMGGRPQFALISLGLPSSLSLKDVQSVYRGLHQAAQEAGCAIVGGDTNAADRLIINVALVGEATRVVTRTGARVGDHVYVTGTLGGSAVGLAALKKKKQKKYSSFVKMHRRPPLRVKVGEVLSRLRGVTSMMDISDGLFGDLRHILDQSHVGAQIEADRIPVPAGYEKACRTLKLDLLFPKLSGGEDYELLFTVSPKARIPSKILGVFVKKVGTIRPYRDGLVLTNQGKRLSWKGSGFRHF